jgi:transcriptional regulator with XRE-family HTH domain
MNGNEIVVVAIKKEDTEKLLTVIQNIEKLPVEVVSGSINIPVTFSTGIELMFAVQGGKMELKQRVSPVVNASRKKERTEFETIVSKQIIDKIKLLRSNNMSTAHIAKVMGVSVGTVSNWEKGSKPQSKVMLTKLMHLQVKGDSLNPMITTDTRKRVDEYLKKNSMTLQQFSELVSLKEDMVQPYLNEEFQPPNKQEIFELLRK